MSLPHALLGLLAVAPASGYELTKEFERDLGRYAWQAGHTSIYPELARLAKRGLVHVTHEGARGAKTYDITPAGHEELRGWLLAPPAEGATVRNEQVLRLFLLSALGPEDQRTLLTRIAERTAAAAGELREVMARGPGTGARAGFGLLAAEFGRRQYEAVHGWALWALESLDRSGSASAAPPPHDPHPAVT